MKACAGDEEEKCEEAGVIYGHWAGQGLQVQDHSFVFPLPFPPFPPVPLLLCCR